MKVVLMNNKVPSSDNVGISTRLGPIEEEHEEFTLREREESEISDDVIHSQYKSDNKVIPANLEQLD